MTNVLQTIVNVGDYQFDLLELPIGGDSLFVAFAHQLLHFDLTHDDLCAYHSRMLRSMCIDYLLTHLQDSNIQVLLVKYSAVKEEQVAYLEQLRTSWQHSDGSEFEYVLARMFSAHMYLYDAHGNVEVVGQSEVPPKHTIRLFRLSTLHYSSIIHIKLRTHSYPLTMSSIAVSEDTPALSVSRDTTDTIGVSQHPNPQYVAPQPPRSINIGCWNVSGGSRSSKRDEIDLVIKREDLDLVCLQEIRMPGGTNYTSHYRWFINSFNRSRSSRGTAILVLKTMIDHVISFTSVTQNICFLVFRLLGRKLVLFCFHSPSEGSSTTYQEYVQLQQLIHRYAKSHEIILMGDWNAHLGMNERETEDKLIGTILWHFETNSNGALLRSLAEINDLEVMTTKLDRSCRVTWKRGDTESQIDHILRKLPSTIYFSKMKGLWYVNLSDHKLLRCRIRLSYQPQHLRQTQHSAQLYTSARRKWDLSLLRNEDIQSSYVNKLHNELQSHAGDKEITWATISHSLVSAANTTLLPTKRPAPLSPHGKTVVRELKRAKFALSKDPTDQTRKTLHEARQTMQNYFHQHRVKEYREFFANLNDYHITERIKRTYSFTKMALRNNPENNTFIPLRRWEEELGSTSSANQTHTEFLASDYCPLLPPPSIGSICDVIDGLKHNKAPGEDSVCSEFLQYGIEEIIDPLYAVIERVWLTRHVPDEWITSLQIPIPKIKRPLSVDDYRRITLTSVGYKIFVILLFQHIEFYLDPILPYQAGFIRGRSTSDQLFVMRRILEERWNEGGTTFILSLDLRRAFDSVSTNHLPALLLQRGVPTQLINLLIATALQSKTSLVWYRHKTHYYPQTRGVKQGCPVSPMLFNLIVDDVIHTLSRELNNFAINLELFQDHRARIHLPCLMAYADDLLLMSSSLDQLSFIFLKLVDYLKLYSLELNAAKTKLLIRDPSRREWQDRYQFGEFQIERVNNVKYLGSPIHSIVHRPLQLHVRKYSALSVYKKLYTHFQFMRLPFSLLRLVYTTVILPVLLYALNVTSLTKANRLTLARKEALMIQGFANIADPPIYGKSPKELLSGKTINRRVSAYRLRYYAHILRRPQLSHLRRAMTLTVRYRRIGRPLITWNKSLMDDFQQYPYSSEEWEAASHDKGLIKQMTCHVFDPSLPEEFDKMFSFDESGFNTSYTGATHQSE